MQLERADVTERAAQQTILFGSKARGDSEPESDIDILIVVGNESWPVLDEISLIASRVSLEYGVLLGPRVVGAERWENMGRERFRIYEDIARDGLRLEAA